MTWPPFKWCVFFFHSFLIKCEIHKPQQLESSMFAEHYSIPFFNKFSTRFIFIFVHFVKSFGLENKLLRLSNAQEFSPSVAGFWLSYKYSALRIHVIFIGFEQPTTSYTYIYAGSTFRSLNLEHRRKKIEVTAYLCTYLYIYYLRYPWKGRRRKVGHWVKTLTTHLELPMPENLRTIISYSS